MSLRILRLRLLQSRPVRRWCTLRARAARWLFGTPTTVLEVLNAGLLLTRVEYLKNNGEHHFAIVDAAMTELLRPALYQHGGETVNIITAELNARLEEMVEALAADYRSKG